MGCVWNLLSVVLFLVDLGTDIYVAVKHFQNGDETWFTFSVLFIVAPFIISFFVVCCLKRCGDNNLEKTVASARYIEAVYESAPQWCLQVYIMLHKWDFPWYTILSAMISLLGLTWGTITLERAAKEDPNDVLLAVLYFCHELSGFISRLVVIAVFAYVFEGWLFIACAVHSVVLAVLLCCMETSCFGSEKCPSFYECLALLGLTSVFSYVFLPFLLHPCKEVFALLQVDQDRLKTYYGCLYFLIFAGNAIMLTLAVAVPAQEVTHMDVVAPLAMGCVIGGTVVNCGFLVCRSRMDV